MSSSHVDNEKGRRGELHDTTITACFSLHYNCSKSCLIANGIDEYQFK